MSLVNDMLNDLDKRRGHHVSEKVDLEWMAGNTSLQPQRRFMRKSVV